jgi:hypothetical protein
MNNSKQSDLMEESKFVSRRLSAILVALPLGFVQYFDPDRFWQAFTISVAYDVTGLVWHLAKKRECFGNTKDGKRKEIDNAKN